MNNIEWGGSSSHSSTCEVNLVQKPSEINQMRQKYQTWFPPTYTHTLSLSLSLSLSLCLSLFFLFPILILGIWGVLDSLL